MSQRRVICCAGYADELRKRCGAHAPMKKQSFGAALGALIKQKRTILGLTQLQLSEDAYQSPSKVRRISELESGTVANPHPKTIDPLIVALKISDEVT